MDSRATRCTAAGSCSRSAGRRVFGSVVGLLLTAVLVVFVELKSRREEQWLTERHPDYADYRRRTPRRFIPYVY